MVDDDKFRPFLIKEYQHWRLYLHENQSALGRTYLWAIREDASDLPSATDEELLEFKQAVVEVEEALSKAFQPDRLNFEFLSNEAHHLHGHIIPRYESKRQFGNLEFEDGNYGGRFYPRRDISYPEEFLMSVKAEIQKNLEKE